MTQDQPPLPEPPKDEPTIPATPEANSEPLAEESPQSPPDLPDETLPQALQRFWTEAQPQIKQQTIRSLKVTIRALEGLVARLEAEPPAKPIRPQSPESGASSTQTDSTSASSPAPAFSTTQLLEKFQPLWQKIQPLWQQAQPTLQRIQPWWTRLLSQVRSRLPESLNEKLSDRALTGAIAGILVVLLWTTSGILSGKPEAPEVAIAPEPEETAPAIEQTPEPQPIPPEIQAPEPPKPIEVSPSPVAVSPSPAPLPTPSPVQASPAPPPLKLTPEQTLIAAIQDQVADISNQYVNGLIQSVQANFRSSRLTVNVGSGWYELSRSQQDKLAGEMLKRAQDLDFSKLEITDPDGALLARSPVVGSEMVILKRSIEMEGTGDRGQEIG